jgi:uncharacterized Zn finger protein (UPF0148 family)
MPKVDIRELILDDECPFCGSLEIYYNSDGLLQCDECGELVVEEETITKRIKKEQVIKKIKSYE